MIDDRRINRRKKFGYYMRVVDNATSDLLGYLSDIGKRGFRLDCQRPMIVNKDIVMRLDLTPEVSDRPYIIFLARCRWLKPDDYDPNSFVGGFHVVNISPHDDEIFNKIVDKYGVSEKL